MEAATTGDNHAPGFAKHPGHKVEFEVSPKRIRATFDGRTIVDSTRALVVRESRHVPVYYFPRDDVAMEALTPTDHSTYCPFKGHASYLTVASGDRRAENAVWSYEDPYVEVAGLKDYVAFYWDRMDAWFEEDEEVFVHARDPHVRVDILDSSRPVRVVLDGETVAETSRARFLFETGLPTRYYIPKDDVRADLLVPSETVTACPYKGNAHYCSVQLGGRLHEDIVWFYDDPVHEAARIRGYLCFFNERVDDIFVDGEAVPKTKTKWSPK